MTDIEKEREAFEAWFSTTDLSSTDSFSRNEGGKYLWVSTFNAWISWLAHSRSERVVSVGELEALAAHWDDGGWRTGANYVEALAECATQLRALIAKAGVENG